MAEIPFQRPQLPTRVEIERYFDLAREARWFSNGGPCWRLLRERLADRVGAYCVPVASGTLGLMVALAAVLEKRGTASARSTALMPSFTFPATAQAALWCQLKPAFVDIAPDEWHLDPVGLERALRERRGETGAVVCVSAFGTAPTADTRSRWEYACRVEKVPLVVDSAAAFGSSSDDGTPVGAQGDVEVVSFHATKPFAIGEGGAVFTRSKALCEKIELIINFGLKPDRTVAIAMGVNAKLSELHAATALAVLDRLDAILVGRRKAAAAVRAQAGAGVQWQHGCERSTWQFVPVGFADKAQRHRAFVSCSDRIEVRRYYRPLHEMAPYRGWQAAGGALASTSELVSRILCFPMANDILPSEVRAISEVLRAVTKRSEPNRVGSAR
jgi:dTDP-4-amino-4,6-dideoxygalactose transaminase